VIESMVQAFHRTIGAQAKRKTKQGEKVNCKTKQRTIPTWKCHTHII
jgi:hypothetical protein